MGDLGLTGLVWALGGVGARAPGGVHPDAYLNNAKTETHKAHSSVHIPASYQTSSTNLGLQRRKLPSEL